MGSRICSNDLCSATTSHQWKTGWPLRSGGFSFLCYNCGSAYEKSLYCETFHSDETGWRDCSSCGKKLHCGCIVSKTLYEFLDYGGVGCINCTHHSRVFTTNEVQKGVSGSINVVGSPQSTVGPNRVVGDSVDKGRLMQLCQVMEANEPRLMPRFQQPELNESVGQSQTKQQEVMPKVGVEVGREFLGGTPSSSVGLFTYPKPDTNRITLGSKDSHESLAEPSLKMTLGTPSRTSNSNFVLALSNGVGDGREQSKTPSPSFKPQRNRPLLPKTLKSNPSVSSESNNVVSSQMRIARPPGEGRGKSHLLPRYWPRITDQELEKLSGDLNSAIVPLFEKVLSASDAGRIGRLVLPKACAEAYFPPISQSEGLPLRVQDVKGNEWTFQFRFWPNNNSRMYVLEGVTPCIQAMQLQAGDTVTFSRINPGGKLVMGFRKASNNEEIQEDEMSASPNGTLGEASVIGAAENPQTSNGYPSPVQNAVYSEHLHLANGESGLHKSEANGFRKSDDSTQPHPQQPVSLTLEKKKTRNIGSKSKRLLMHSEDVLELRLTWEEAQDLLRPPSGSPNVVTIEDQEFEEYNEPPVFGKRTLFVARPQGVHEQWAQCDECSKWRRLPMEVLLPSKWTCSDNEWDSSRVSCTAPEEISLKRLENLLRTTRDLKKRRRSQNRNAAVGEPQPQGEERSGLDALASAAVLGDNGATTTRHPRHRPGCSCIVCIQPPSGKGKHKPTCICNVCMTVKRRFKTLMLRRKKRQFEAVPEPPKNDDGGSTSLRVNDSHAAETSGAGQIDLNCHPSREDMQMEPEMVEINVVQKEPVNNGQAEQQTGAGLGSGPHLVNEGDSERDVTKGGFGMRVGSWERESMEFS